MDPTAKLSIRFAESVAPSGDSPIVAEVVDSRFAVVWRGQVSLATSQQVALDEAGPYLVRAWLPNGELITANANATSGESTDVPLYPQLVSPHEDMAWAYYGQPTPGIPSVGAPKDADKRGFLGFHRSIYANASVSVVQHGREGLLRRRSGGQISLKDSADSRESSSSLPRLRLEGGDPIRFRVLPNSGPLWLEIDITSASSKQIKGKWWAVLPTVRGNEIEVLLGLDDANGLRFNVKLDPFTNTVLSYLTQGEYAMTRYFTEEMAARAEKIFASKGADPVLATVAAYALLCAGDFRRMHDWAYNLADWFSELPDGPVIAAWYVLRTTGDLKRTREYFYQAAERGVPVFSVGLRLLFELGEVFASDEVNMSDPFDRKCVDWLRNLEGARQPWSPVTLLKNVEPIGPTRSE
jgi:hypothetical protein